MDEVEEIIFKTIFLTTNLKFLKSAECAPLLKKILIEYVVRPQFESLFLSFGKL